MNSNLKGIIPSSKTCIILVGIPASGKSTLANQIENYYEGKISTILTINRDSERMRILRRENHMFDPNKNHNMWDFWDDKLYGDEERKWYAHQLEIALTLKRGLVIIDNMNLSKKKTYTLVDNFRCKGFTVIIHHMEANPLYEDIFSFIEADSSRQHSVGSSVINDCYIQYCINYHPTEAVAHRPIILVDIDGTIAHNTSGRSFFSEGEELLKDETDSIVKFIVSSYWAIGIQTVFLSGRKSKAYDFTTQWFENNSIPYKELFMRRSYDNRPDHIVKKEIYDNVIKHRYNVIAVFDDRPSVVDMWNDLGLKCFACKDQRIKF